MYLKSGLTVPMAETAGIRAGEVYPGYPNYRELQYGHADGNQWVAAECDVSIRPG